MVPSTGRHPGQRGHGSNNEGLRCLASLSPGFQKGCLTGLGRVNSQAGEGGGMTTQP